MEQDPAFFNSDRHLLATVEGCQGSPSRRALIDADPTLQAKYTEYQQLLMDGHSVRDGYGHMWPSGDAVEIN